MSFPKRIGKKSSGTDTPAEPSSRMQRLDLPMGSSLLRTAHINFRPEVTNINFRPPATQDSLVVHHYGRPYVPTLAPANSCQGCYGANNYNNFLLGHGTKNVTSWLQSNIPQRGFSNFTSVRFPPPARPNNNPLPTYPFAYPGNENPNALQGFNYIAHQQSLLGNGPSFRGQVPRGQSLPINIYMPTGPAPTSNSIIIIPDDSPPKTLIAAQSSPLRTNRLVPGEEADRDPSSKDKGKSKHSEEDEHKCYACNKLFESGKALGGHMSAHEKKRKRELTEARRSFMTSASTADGAGSSRWCANRTDGRDELDAADDEDDRRK